MKTLRIASLLLTLLAGIGATALAQTTARPVSVTADQSFAIEGYYKVDRSADAVETTVDAIK